MRSPALIGFVLAALCIPRVGMGGTEQECIEACLRENQQASVGYQEIEQMCREMCTVTRALQLVRSDDPDEYAEGVEILFNSDDPRAVAPLIDALRRDLEERTGRWALIIPALGAQRDEAAVPVLIETLTLPDDDWLGREMSADALGKIGSPSAIPALTTAAWRGDTRDEAIGALSLILDRRVVPTLISALEPGEDSQTREAAMEGLRRLGSEAVPDLVEALAEYGPEHPETERRVWICRLLGESGNAQSLAALEAIRSDPDPAVAQCAAAGIEAAKNGN